MQLHFVRWQATCHSKWHHGLNGVSFSAEMVKQGPQKGRALLRVTQQISGGRSEQTVRSQGWLTPMAAIWD